MSAGSATLRGRRVLVVGASSGIGRAFARLAIAAGSEVVVAGRRLEALEEALAGAERARAIAVDVRDPEACSALVKAALDAVGPLELVLCSVGVAKVVRMIEAGDTHWAEVLATNVTGLNQLIAAAVPAMAPGGLVAVLSSDTVGAPRIGLGPYGASKAAVDQSLLSWRAEHPEVRFTTVVLGGTLPTGFADLFDPEATAWALEQWVRQGRMQREQMQTDELATALAGVLASALDNPGVGFEELRLRSPSPIAASLDELVL